jgi:hypothetical protein
VLTAKGAATRQRIIEGAAAEIRENGVTTALDFEIPADGRRLLDEASAPRLPSVYSMFTPQYQSWVVSPGLGIGDKPSGYAPPVFNGVS